jgi:hypothetical protein
MTVFPFRSIILVSGPTRAETSEFYHSPEECELKGYADVPVYTCQYCGQRFTTQALLNQHLASKHPNPEFLYSERIDTTPKRRA